MTGSAPGLFALAALLAGVTGLLVRRWWLALGAAVLVGLAAVVSGSFPTSAAWDGVDALSFVAGMAIVGAAADLSGLLAVVGRGLARRRPSPPALVAVTFLAAVALTTVANLDTTAVLFTPLAVEIALASGLPVTPFVLAAVLGANFGSMLLPTSNLTNLVLWRHSGQSFGEFAAANLPVALAATVVTVAALLVAARRLLRVPALVGSGAQDGAATGPPAHDITGRDPARARGAVAAVGLLVLVFFAGVPVGPAALVAGLALTALRPALWKARLDGRLAVAIMVVICAAGLVVAAVDPAARLSSVSPVGLAALGAGLSAVVTNLAAVLLLEPVAGRGELRTALLMGVNLGVGVTPVASLATVLWSDALRAKGVPVPWRAYLAVGLPLSAVFVLLAGLIA